MYYSYKLNKKHIQIQSKKKKKNNSNLKICSSSVILEITYLKEPFPKYYFIAKINNSLTFAAKGKEMDGRFCFI